ncbi:MAG: hypothetical protein AB7S41_12120 [Parvibaculaceae bacterium]
MTRHERIAPEAQAEAVAEYKAILREVLDARPSGTRQRLADALGKNRSFVSQIANPQYATPIPATHLDLIFEICHFPPATRERFLSAYARAHSARLARRHEPSKLRRHTILLPDLGSAQRNQKIDALVADFVRKLTRILDEPE